ncbi:MAG: TonB-dependent receptor [Pseudomonadota bacterium]
MVFDSIKRKAGRASVLMIGLGSLSISPLLSPSAFAQTEEAASQLDTIIVTARKVEEPLQRIPFGITVIEAPSDILETRRFAKETPGLNFTEAGVRTANTTNIRGVGSFLPLSFEDSSVPVFVDGVPLPLGAIDLDFFDIKRIEVLRGPQSSVFGRNAQAGAINITTNDPTDTPELMLGFEAGNLEQYRGKALLNGPLSKSVNARLAIQYSTRDGDVPDINLGDSARDQDVLNLNGKLAWTPGPKTNVILSARYGKYDEEPVQGLLLENAQFPQLSLDMKTDLDLDTLGVSMRIEHELGFARLTSITGVEHYEGQLSVDDSDGLVFSALTGFPSFVFNDPNNDFRNLDQANTQISQELRLDGRLGNGLIWIAGIEFLTTDAFYDSLSNTQGVLFGEFQNDFKTNSYAAYGEVTVPVSQRFQIAGGVRVTHEEKTLDALFEDRSGLGMNFSDDGEDDFTLVTGRASAVYDFAEQVSGFVTIAHGAKSGGFQLIDTDLAFGFPVGEFDSARTWTYEAGSRGSLAGGKLAYSASVFFNDTQDEHIPVFQLVPFQGIVENLDTETYGAELEVAVEPVQGFTLRGALSLLDTEITASDTPTVSAGNEVPFAPDLSYSLGARYEHPFSIAGLDGVISGSIQYQFVGERTTDAENNLELGSFDLINLRAGWDSERFSVYAFVDNATDDVYPASAFFIGPSPTGSPVSFGFPGRPRLYGVGATVRFSGR